jgi:hypothetical protein
MLASLFQSVRCCTILLVSENSVPRRIFVPSRDEMRGGEGNCVMRSSIISDLYQRVLVSRIREINAYKILIGKPEGRQSLVRPRCTR